MPTVMNGVSLNALTTVDSWSALSLFANGEQGVWYDPSDMSTMFQDAAGTTPAALEQPVGLILDKSKNLALGAELVTNGDFSNGTTGWSTFSTSGTATLSVTSGVATLTCPTGSSYATAYQAITTVVGRTYKVTGTNISGTSTVFNGLRKSDTDNGGANTVTIYGGNGVLALGNASGVFVATATTSYILAQTNGAGSSITLDNISVREIAGNHASQSTSTSRPVLSARYNLLIKTEQIEDSIWTKGRCTVISNDQVAPDGTLTVDKISCTETGAGFFVWRTNNVVTVPVNTNITFSAVSKRGSRDQCVLSYTSGSSGANGINAIFNLATGTYVSTVTFGSGVSVVGTPTITDLGNGYYRMSLTVNSNTTSANPVFYPSITSSSDYSCISGVDFGYLWGTDLRVTNNSVGLPVYQRVNTSTDYDATNFPPYLKFDGVDDFFQTATISPGSVDKAQIFAGVRKITDSAAYQVIAESSFDIETNNGAFVLATNVGTYEIFSKGTIRANAAASGYSAPITNVVASLLDISGDRTTLRVNGGQVAQSTADQGMSNFGSYPLYVGLRYGAATRALFLNGHLYSLILRFSASNLDSNQIENAETWINNKTKAY